MPRWAYFVCDLVAISLLAFAIYFPRYRRRDLLVAYLCVNVGVMAVIVALTSSMEGVGVGVGFGLFGVLSIVRLRSSELAQQELAYYFVALALGLLGGLEITPAWIVPVLSAAMVAAVAIGDHPRIFARYRQQVLTLDRAFTDERVLHAHVEQLMGARVHHLIPLRTDLVNDTTVVDVRYQVPRPGENTPVRPPDATGAARPGGRAPAPPPPPPPPATPAYAGSPARPDPGGWGGHPRDHRPPVGAPRPRRPGGSGDQAAAYLIDGPARPNR